MVTADQAKFDAAPSDGVVAHGPEWRQLNPRLWVGRDGTTVLGTIEQGSRFVFVDVEGAPHEPFRTLGEAQDSATRPITLPVSSRPRPLTMRDGRPIRTMLVVVGMLLIACTCWWLGSVLLTS